MENHDTFNIANALDFDNWVTVGQAMLKMAGFFWPMLLLVAVFVIIEWKRERVNVAK